MPRPTPIYVLGDSHIFALSDQLFRASWGELIEFRALYLRDVRTSDFVRPDGALDDRIQRALHVARIGPKRWILTENPVGQRSSIGTGNWPGIRVLEDRTESPALVIATGSLDSLQVGFGISELDLELPSEIRDDPGTPEICRTAAPGALPADEAWRRFSEPLEPLRAVLRMFRASGITRVAVLGHPPISTDDDECERSYREAGYPPAPRASQLAWRYKTLLLTNAALRRIAVEEGVPFVERWAAYSQDGLVRSGVLRDFVHVGEEGTVMTAAALVDVLVSEPNSNAASDGATSAAIRDLYDTSYYVNECGGHEQYALFGGRKLEEPRLAAVYALAAVERGARVLDLGSGRGELSYAFAAAGAHVTALDYSADAIALARTTLGELPAQFVCADASTFEDAVGYDVAVAAMLVEHFAPDELAQLYRNVAAMLRPGGSLIVHASTHLRTPAAHRQLLGEAFEHVLLWVPDGEDPRGSLVRPFDAAELQSATDVFAIASHAPIDTERVLERMTMVPLTGDEAAAIALSAPSAPQQVRAGEPFVVELTLRNDSARVLTSFAPNPMRFAYAWSAADSVEDMERAFATAPGRSRLEPASEPGSTRRYALGVVAPLERGPHLLRITLVQELVRWFDLEVQLITDVV